MQPLSVQTPLTYNITSEINEPRDIRDSNFTMYVPYNASCPLNV